MARAALKWSVRDVAAAAQVSPNTVTRIESGGTSNASTLGAIRYAFEAAGVTFLADGEASPAGGPGVRLDVDGGGDGPVD
ncbi:helix-turn-helix domain-containing protein [Xanthobacter versatilis]|uniref:helix-turn-helix domain-containing protein n=1 Tax=Xanthobacter autotrophicus (strain ATCC BAA-1158 / Py2) TaxID=78245 RepID=UPI00372936D5